MQNFEIYCNNARIWCGGEIYIIDCVGFGNQRTCSRFGQANTLALNILGPRGHSRAFLCFVIIRTYQSESVTIANHLCGHAKGFVALLKLPLTESSVPNFKMDQTPRLTIVVTGSGTYDETSC